MQKIILTVKRKRILAYWYSYNIKHRSWPSFRVAAEDLGISKFCIHYHIKALIEKEWMKKINDSNFSPVALTSYGLSRLQEFERIALGISEKKKPVNLKKYTKPQSNEKN